ncbi:MAG: glycosyltransferase [Proteobacteria bacterium]|nr:glycosyltransferase [Pseudomonadota bacterium]
MSSSADYGTIFAPNICLSYYYSLPNKLFEYIVCGLPIVTTPLYDMRMLIQSEGIGATTADFSEQAIFDTVKSITARPDPELRARIRALHRDKYNWGIEERTLLAVYRNA